MSVRKEIAIVGAGPAGCTLAALLAQRGLRVAVFDDEKRPELLVGESLLPSVVTLMRRLGIEDRVREFSQHKPGVAFQSRTGMRMDFFFPARALRGRPNYAYNIPRPEFDRLLRARAEELGVRFVSRRAEVEPGEGGREVQLKRETLGLVPEWEGRHPELLVDATGRARAFSRLLGIPARRGARNDAAYFAHYEGFEGDAAREGQVVITTLEHGWSWRIPLKDRLSVGVVVDKRSLEGLPKDPGERLEAILEREPVLAEAGRGRRRVSETMVYTNYQLISERGHGPGWVAVGDAYGFVDPMLSPGLFMAMWAAERLDALLFRDGWESYAREAGRERRMKKYFAELEDWHAAWTEVIEYFYNGRMFALYEAGSGLAQKYGRFSPAVWMERHLTKQVTRLVSGVATRSRYGRALLKLSHDRLVWGVEPAERHAVRV